MSDADFERWLAVEAELLRAADVRLARHEVTQ